MTQMKKFKLGSLYTACGQLKFFAVHYNSSPMNEQMVSTGIKSLIERLRAKNLLEEKGDEYNSCWE
jgi:hypothetical protein